MLNSKWFVYFNTSGGVRVIVKEYPAKKKKKGHLIYNKKTIKTGIPLDKKLNFHNKITF